MSLGNGYSNGIPIITGRFAQSALPDRLPPQNIEAEQSLLGGILLEPARLPEVLEIIDVPDFYRDVHQVIFRAIRDLHDNGEPIDAVTLADELMRQGQWEKMGGDAMLLEIVEAVPHAANCLYYAGIIKEKSHGRRLLDVFTEGIHAVYSGEHTAAEVLEAGNRGLAGITADEDEELELPAGWPDPLAEAAYCGPLGEIARAIAPHTSADVVAILIQSLVAWGNLIGRGPHWMYEATRHSLNLFACIVGASSRGAKGTSLQHVRSTFRAIVQDIDPDWERKQIRGGFASGEALIDVVRDEQSQVRKGEREGQWITEVIQPAVNDKRVVWLASEMGSMLTLKGRDGSILGFVLRDAWDGEVLEANSRKNPTRASGAHISIIGHITMSELEKCLTRTDIDNGFANRFLWACVRRSKLMPFGGDFQIDRVYGEIEKLQKALRTVLRVNWREPISIADDAQDLWRQVHPHVARPRPGSLDALCARAEAQVWRMAGIYSTSDGCPTQIQLRHLLAALAMWDYCEASVGCIFAARPADRFASRILDCLRTAPQGLTRREVNRAAFGGRKPLAELDVSLIEMLKNGLATVEKVQRNGKPCMLWRPK